MKPVHKHITHAHLLAFIIVLAAFALSAIVSRSTFERLPHLEDEIAYLYQARIFAGGHAVIEPPEPRQAYWQPFVIDHEGKRFGKYPPGWPLLLSIGVRLGQPWLINAFCMALSAALVYRLGAWIFDDTAGLIAAALWATSPVALLLAGSLMSHTSAACLGLLWVYGLWQLQHRRRWEWAAFAGAVLGFMISTRTLTTVALALPFFVWLGLVIAWRGLRTFWRRESAKSAAAFVALMLPFAILLPAFNNAAVGDPGANLYTLVWDYDRIGFGDCCGPSGHTPEKAFYNMRRDLRLLASDMFGWQMSDAVYDRLHAQHGWWMGKGIGWLFLPLGLIVARRKPWAWALLGTFACIVALQWLFWSGAQLYGPRYYFEALPALVLLSGAGVAAFIRWLRLPGELRPAVCLALVGAFCMASLITYAPARLGELWRYNSIGQNDVDALEALRDGRPVLILVTGEEHRSWYEWGTYMALTGPYLDSDVVAARDRWPDARDVILARFPDRQVLYLVGNQLQTHE